MPYPELPAHIEILPGTDVAGAWDRFAPLEAMHHLHRICNPMTEIELDHVLDLLGLPAGARMIDLACGHGEFLIRAAERQVIDGVGLDLSPWVLLRAVERAKARDVRGSLSWRLGDVFALPRDRAWDVATILGASWIWHGFEGTVRALSRRVYHGGAIAIGDLRLRTGADPASVEHAAVITERDQLDALHRHGFEPAGCLVAPDEAWERYHLLVMDSVNSYTGPVPGDYTRLAQEWMAEFEHDRGVLEWTVWVATLR